MYIYCTDLPQVDMCIYTVLTTAGVHMAGLNTVLRSATESFGQRSFLLQASAVYISILTHMSVHTAHLSYISILTRMPVHTTNNNNSLIIIYHALINALSAHMIHINSDILYTCRAHSYQNNLHKVFHGKTNTHYTQTQT